MWRATSASTSSWPPSRRTLANHFSISRACILPPLLEPLGVAPTQLLAKLAHPAAELPPQRRIFFALGPLLDAVGRVDDVGRVHLLEGDDTPVSGLPFILWHRCPGPSDRTSKG